LPRYWDGFFFLSSLWRMLAGLERNLKPPIRIMFEKPWLWFTKTCQKQVSPDDLEVIFCVFYDFFFLSFTVQRC
jgi:hypothetical protein